VHAVLAEGVSAQLANILKFCVPCIIRCCKPVFSWPFQINVVLNSLFKTVAYAVSEVGPWGLESEAVDQCQPVPPSALLERRHGLR